MFDSIVKFTSITSSSLYLKNSSEFLRRNIFNSEENNYFYGSEKYHVFSIEQGIRHGLKNKINIFGIISGSSLASSEGNEKENHLIN